jgi:hypothetical protein
MVPPRRMSLGEMEAFPVQGPEVLQSPPMPKLEEVLEPRASTSAKPLYRLATIAFIVIAVLGGLAAARFFMTAAHQSSPAQE